MTQVIGKCIGMDVELTYIGCNQAPYSAHRGGGFAAL